MPAPPSFPFKLAALALLLLGLMSISYVGMNRARQAPEPNPLASLTIPDFNLTDQNGKEQTRDIFKNRWTILAFTFTHCTTVCPIMHGHLIRLQSELKNTPLRIVSISVDPAHDTPEALKAHAEKIAADPDRWTFLTGDADIIHRILTGLRFSADPDPSLAINLPDGNTMANILHPSKLLLIGPDATVRAMETGLDWSGPASLLRRVREERLEE